MNSEINEILKVGELNSLLPKLGCSLLFSHENIPNSAESELRHFVHKSASSLPLLLHLLINTAHYAGGRRLCLPTTNHRNGQNVETVPVSTPATPACLPAVCPALAINLI